jgi:outer membrane protein assembly factor BamB
MTGPQHTPGVGRGCRAGAVCLAFLAPSALAQPEWPSFGGGADQSSQVVGEPIAISTAAWVLSRDSQNRAITFNGQAGLVVTRDLVLATGYTFSGSANWRLYAVDRRTGSLVWTTPITAPYFDSWSSPVLDQRNRRVIVTNSTSVVAFDLRGTARWTATLDRQVVNASAVVTTDLGLANRLFITDFDGFGTDAKLYCINIDPRIPVVNPHDPGEILWSVPIGGASGNSPAYADGVVYVSSVGEYNFQDGAVFAFDARATSAPEPLWVFQNPSGQGFFGGLAYRADDEGGSLYVASYNFTGARTSSELLRLSAKDGELIWSAGCNRTSATPVPYGDGSASNPRRVLVSGGFSGFGTQPSVQIYSDGPESGELIWDSVAATWKDLDRDGNCEPGEYLSIGGWSHQPVMVTDEPKVQSIAGGRPLRLYAGTLSSSANTTLPCVRLSAIDVSALPSGGPFLVGTFDGAGSTPAIAGRNLYTIGIAGLYAFGPAPYQYDVTGDGGVDLEDLYAWEQSRGRRDVNLDGVVNDTDRQLLIDMIRQPELEEYR